MEKLSRIITAGLIVLILLVGGILYKMPVGNPGDVSLNLGGGGGDYNFQQFSGAIATTTTLKSAYGGTFGGVVITEDFAGYLEFLSATSTTAYAITNAVRIADFQTASAEGEYWFNAAYPNALIMKSQDGFSFAGDITVLFN